MTTLVLGTPPPELEALIERRRQAGVDRLDEVWQGVRHVVPGPSFEHARLVDTTQDRLSPRFNQLLKWVGNKQRFAAEIVDAFPPSFGRYYEPFLGSGAVLATLAPDNAAGSDVFPPLMEIWAALADDPESLKVWYADRWAIYDAGDPREAYERKGVI